MNNPKELLYSKTHEWVKMLDETTARIGLTDYAQGELGDLVFVNPVSYTHLYIHRAINSEAFPNAVDLYDQKSMTGRGRGRYCYRPEARGPAESFLREQIEALLPEANILYIC